MIKYQLNFFKATDIGLKRKLNEDHADYNSDLQFFVIADGMGGHQAGEIASAMAVHCASVDLSEFIQNNIDTKRKVDAPLIENTLIRIIENTNSKIFTAGNDNQSHQGMGTTIVVGVFIANAIHFAHVGDSRLYLYRHKLLIPLTKDHTLLQEMLDKSPKDEEHLRQTIQNNIITQALGAKEYVDVSYGECEIKDNDVFFSTTDGVHDAIPHSEFESLAEAAQANKELSVLIDKANKCSGSDNSTIVMVEVKAKSNSWLKWFK